MPNHDSHLKNFDADRERLSWILIALGAVSILTVKLIFLSRFAENFPQGLLAGFGGMMSWGEACFLLFPYLGLAYFRLYAARTPGTRRLAAALAAGFLVSSLIMGLALADSGRGAVLNFYFHSLVCLALQSAATLSVAGGLWPVRNGHEWRPAELLAFIPLLAAAVMFMSNISMMWTRLLTETALAAPYAFLALDGTGRLIVSSLPAKVKAGELAQVSPAAVLRAWPIAGFVAPPAAGPKPERAVFALPTARFTPSSYPEQSRF